jgi:hypothetical protein
LFRSDGSTVGGPPLLGQQAPNSATASQPNPKVAASVVTMPGGSGGDGSTTPVKEAADATSAVAAKKAADATDAKEAVAKKTTADVTTVNKFIDDADARVVAEDSSIKAATIEKAAKESATREAANMEATKKAAEESSGSGSSPAPGVGSKRAATSGCSTPPSKQFRSAWKPRYAEHLCNHLSFHLFALYLIGIFVVQCAYHWYNGSGVGGAFRGAQDAPEGPGPQD